MTPDFLSFGLVNTRMKDELGGKSDLKLFGVVPGWGVPGQGGGSEIDPATPDRRLSLAAMVRKTAGLTADKDAVAAALVPA
ncbi:hypothetical protein CPLU01_03086 [Colletotrichum plurivorum]|uniref:Uncharacterized protein n=1 Tax=Colletotrichum plurivorum TaxID=2175906 RepID=A0A8H6KTP2_9PEZI|nr:hypothetical protein CPLU01_03086 [Colletotrichum plurivorum]